ncbi:hypothetical protein OPV22_003135 [Ensete ventricosum]|uniref:Uncharacterized protein n=1 Tax=Ensete ventricosum TaxID=4639 RepID=A0AAV8RZX1_ENSVE|nr:hypothetical protein OPV22_003135 [Ensete ventricosum]
MYLLKVLCDQNTTKLWSLRSRKSIQAYVTSDDKQPATFIRAHPTFPHSIQFAHACYYQPSHLILQSTALLPES